MRQLTTVNSVELGKWEGTLQGALPWRRTAGVEPCAVKAARTVLNGGREETCSNATRLAPTQQFQAWDIAACFTDCFT